MSIYLQQLTVRLAEGLGKLDPGLRERHTGYLQAAQQVDGGFAGRAAFGEPSESDLYYTAFAMRALSILGELDGMVAERASDFLQQQMERQQTIVDFFSLVYGAGLLQVSAGIDVFASSDPAWPDQVAAFLERLRREDGGYAKAPEGHAGSTYHTFLVMLVYELIERPLPAPHAVVDFLRNQAAADGGFREIRASKRAGTNPTAAAIGALRILDQLDEETSELTIDFLFEMQTDEGGLRANTRIPIADALSSFTGMLTLDDLEALDEIELVPMQRYVDSLQLPGGGFRAATWDEAHDVEYTFYGLGCLALLANAPDRYDLAGAADEME